MEGCEEHTVKNGSITITTFTIKGIVVARRKIEIYGNYKNEAWYNSISYLHRDGDEPALIEYKDEKVTYCAWYKDGKIHRDGDEPAVIYYEDDKVTSRAWYKNGWRHCDDDKPAVICYKNDKVIYHVWYRDGNRHREKEPAKIYIKDDIIVNEWWIDGDQIPYADVPEAIRLPPALRATLRRLPLPIGDAIALYCEWIWPLEEYVFYRQIETPRH